VSIVEIKYNLKKDLDNYSYGFLNSRFPDYGQGDLDTAPRMWSTIKKKIEETDENKKIEVIEKYLLDNFYEKEVMKLSMEAIDKYWSTIESAYFNKLHNFMGIKKKIPKIDVYFTTLNIYPYNVKGRYFYIPFFAGLAVQAKTIMHESMHLVFLHNYGQYLSERGIDKQGTLEIAESLTVLLNWEFKEFLLFPERNSKPTTIDLQKEIVALYKKNTSFKEILDRLIELRIMPT